MLRHSHIEGPDATGLDRSGRYVVTPLKALMDGLIEGLPAVRLDPQKTRRGTRWGPTTTWRTSRTL
jgi:hypothetical protein